jgi:hypothetical protein
MYKVKQSDLIGEVKDFPIEVIQKMLERQVEQGNKADVSIFQECNIEDLFDGGFEWCETEEGDIFWNEVISWKNFDLFFKRYPKTKNEEL